MTRRAAPSPTASEPFTCPRHQGSLRITPRTCADMFLRRRRAGKHDEARVRLWACAGCEIGARNARVALPPPPPRPPYCARCGRDDLRLIAGRLCVGCYNRQREVLQGRNRKGNYPVEHAALLSFELLVLRGEGTARVRIDGVVGLVEASVTATRSAGVTAVSLRPAWPPVPTG